MELAPSILRPSVENLVATMVQMWGKWMEFDLVPTKEIDLVEVTVHWKDVEMEF